MSSIIRLNSYSLHSPLIISSNRPRNPSGVDSRESPMPWNSTSTTPSTQSSSRQQPISTQPSSTSPLRGIESRLWNSPARSHLLHSFPKMSKSRLKTRRKLLLLQSSLPKMMRNRLKTYWQNWKPTPYPLMLPLKASNSKKMILPIITSSSWVASPTCVYIFLYLGSQLSNWRSG